MILKRLWWTMRMCMISGGEQRAKYARDNNIFALVGKNVLLQSRIVPLYSELIKLHDNVRIASNVTFVTHDGIHNMINRIENREYNLSERIGCIEIGKNSFIGSNSTIMYDVKIGENVIVGANSFVKNDLSSGGVYAGVPAKRIGDFKDYIEKRTFLEKNGLISTTKNNQRLTSNDINNAWKKFYDLRK